MGGFAGIFGAIEVARVRRMGRGLDARGPAARWEHAAPGFAVAVVGSGVASPGSPIGAADGVIAAVDGHVPQAPALAAELDLPVESGVGTVVAALIARTGFVRAVARLPADVAVAAWHEADRRGEVSRDRAGQRALVWATVPGGMVFATEARVLALAGLAGEPSPGAQAALVALGALVPPSSVRAGVWALEPGGVASFHREVQTAPGPRPTLHPSGAGGNVDRWTRSVRYGLDLAFASRARGAGPYALALGGLASRALVAVRPRDVGPALALTLRVNGVVEPGAAEAARAAGLPLREVDLSAEALGALLDEVAPHPGWVRPEAWAWAALAQAAWKEGLSGLGSGVGARAAFDPPMPGPLAGRLATPFAGLRARLRGGEREDPSVRFASEFGAFAEGDPVALGGLAAELPTDPDRAAAWLNRQVALPEVELCGWDAACAAHGLALVAPFADPALLQVVCAVPAGVHHHGGRRALLAAIASGGVAGGTGAAAPRVVELPLSEWLRTFALDSLPDRVGGLLSGDHVRAMVQRARAGEPLPMRRIFALEMIARGLVG